jgi:hypothetical protein
MSVMTAVGAVVAATTIGAIPVSVAGGVAAATTFPSAVEIFGKPFPVTTSTGKHLRLTVGGASFGTPSTPPVHAPASIDVTLATKNGAESHQWVFQLAEGSFKDKIAKSKGDLNTGPSQIAPFGHVDAAFSPAAKGSTLVCGHTTVKSRPLNVVTSVFFDTQTAGWGKVGTKTHPFVTTVASRLRTQYGGAQCPKPKPTRCLSEVTWGAADPATFVDIEGRGIHHTGSIDASQFVSLTTPSEASRTDNVTVSAPRPVLIVASGKPTLKVKSHGGLVTGSATLSSSVSADVAKIPCRHKGTEKQRGWTDVAFANGPSPLTIHEQIEGPLSMADNSTAGSITKTVH